MIILTTAGLKYTHMHKTCKHASNAEASESEGCPIKVPGSSVGWFAALLKGTSAVFKK